MLEKLFIQNYALIHSLEFCPPNGFVAITGETGAGKSILVGALSLLLGKRADTAVLFNKDFKCVVEGLWKNNNNISLHDFLIHNDLDINEDIILRREINSQGKSRAFINDTPVSLNTLKEISSILVNVSSQHETLNLVSSDFQIEMIDNYAGIIGIRNEYLKLFRESKSISQTLKILEDEEKKAAQEISFLEFQLDELKNLKYTKGEYVHLEEELKILENSELISSSIAESLSVLNVESGIIDKFDYILSKLKKASNYHVELNNLFQRIYTNYLDIKDIIIELENISTDMDISPNRLEYVKERLNSINSLVFKHRLKDPDDLELLINEIQNKLNSLLNLSSEKDSLSIRMNEVLSSMSNLANELSLSRHKNSILIEESVTNIVRELGMLDAIFKIDIQKTKEFNQTGKDKVEFLFSANKGNGPENISKVASGGELSRLMLALKIVSGKENQVSTMIFDEIDTGISGLVADAVGKKLKDLSTFVQVISITHLPQIAGKADSQFKVFKENNLEKTVTGIRKLSSSERIEELSIMISGKSKSSAGEAAAKELLQY